MPDAYWTAEIETADGEDITEDVLRERLEAAGFRVRSWVPGPAMLAESSLRNARQAIRNAGALVSWALGEKQEDEDDA